MFRSSMRPFGDCAIICEHYSTSPILCQLLSGCVQGYEIGVLF